MKLQVKNGVKLFCEVTVIKNNIKVDIDEGKAQIKNYWITKIEKDVFGDSSIIDKSFVNSKLNGKTKVFQNIEDGDYLIQLGKDTSKDTSKRIEFKVENGEIEQY